MAMVAQSTPLRRVGERQSRLPFSCHPLRRAPANRGMAATAAVEKGDALPWQGVHHVGLICEDLDTSLAFWHGLLGMDFNLARPDDRLPYRGAWLWVGPEMVHLMELPNPDPTHLDFRPDHGGRDRHFCVGIEDIQPLIERLDAEGVPYTASKSGRPAVFFRDPDCNTLEVVQGDMWR